MPATIPRRLVIPLRYRMAPFGPRNSTWDRMLSERSLRLEQLETYLISYPETCEILSSELAVRIQLYHELKTTKILVVRDRCVGASHGMMATFIVKIPTNGNMLANWKPQNRCLCRQSENQTDCIFRELISPDQWEFLVFLRELSGCVSLAVPLRHSLVALGRLPVCSWI